MLGFLITLLGALWPISIRAEDQFCVLKAHELGFRRDEIETVQRVNGSLQASFVGVVATHSEIENALTPLSRAIATRMQDPEFYTLDARNIPVLDVKRVAAHAYHEATGQDLPADAAPILTRAIVNSYPENAAATAEHFVINGDRLIDSVHLSPTRMRLLIAFSTTVKAQRSDLDPLQVRSDLFDKIHFQRQQSTVYDPTGAKRRVQQRKPALKPKDLRPNLQQYIKVAVDRFMKEHEALAKEAILYKRNPAEELEDEIEEFVKRNAGAIPENASLLREVLTKALTVNFEKVDPKRISKEIHSALARERQGLHVQIAPEIQKPETEPLVVTHLDDTPKGPFSNRPVRERQRTTPEDKPAPNINGAPDFEKWTDAEVRDSVAESSIWPQRILKDAERFHPTANGPQELLAELNKILWTLNNGSAAAEKSRFHLAATNKDIAVIHPFGSGSTVRAFAGVGASGKYYLLQIDLSAKSGNGTREDAIIRDLARRWRSLKGQR